MIFEKRLVGLSMYIIRRMTIWAEGRTQQWIYGSSMSSMVKEQG
jgi:hypothetical protein